MIVLLVSIQVVVYLLRIKLINCSHFQFQEIRYRATANFVPSVTGLRPWEGFRVGANRGIGSSVRNPRASRVDRSDL